MIDINNILTQALTAAVAEATKPLLERIEVLTSRLDTLSAQDVAMGGRIEALEGVDHERDHALTLRYLGGAREEIDALKARVWALENSPATGDTLSPDDLVQVKQRIEALEQATPETPAAISAAAFVTYLDQQEWFWEKLTRKAAEAAESAVEEAINDHCTTYDHDDYDNVSSAVNEVDLDDMVRMDNLSDEIRRVLREASISIDV